MGSISQINVANQIDDFFNKIRLNEEVGKGAYAKVYSATHLSTGNQLAVKVIDVKKAFAIRSVSTELNALESLHHPNIIKLYGHAFEKKKAFVVLEYLPHPNLAVALDHGTFNEEEVRSITRQVCLALKAAHAKGIAHHDVKTDNVILTDSGVAKLLDWGLAIFQADPKALCKEFSGSPLYLPPEVLSHKPFNPFLADVWAVGVLAFELLTGQVPFDSDSYDDLVSIVTNDYVPLVEYASTEFDDFIQRTLAKNPEDRLSLNQVINHPWLNMQN